MTPELLSDLPILGSDCWNDIGVHGNGSCPDLERQGHCRNCPVYIAAGETLFEREAPLGYHEEWAHRLNGDDEHDDDQNRRAVVIFRVADEWFALDVGVLLEVAEDRAIHSIPHRSNRVLLGLVNIRGELQLCASVLALLKPAVASEEASRASGSGRRMIVTEYQGQRWVLTVNEVAGVAHLTDEDFRDVPDTLPGGTHSLTRQLVRWNSQTVGWIDSASLFRQLARSVG